MTKPANCKPLRLRPWTVKQAVPFIAKHHRRLPSNRPGFWAISVRHEQDVVGCAVVGHPAQALMEDHATLAVMRVAVIGADPGQPTPYPNACSMLYGACSRAAKAMGADNLVTYTHGDEDGVTLRGAGWVEDGMTDGGEYSRPSRYRAPVVDAEPKKRWWAPWSKRAQAKLAALAARPDTGDDNG